MSDVKNTADLRKMLLETIDSVRKGSVDPRQAQAISALSSRILQSAKLDLEMARAEERAKNQAVASVSLLPEVAKEAKKRLGRPPVSKPIAA